MRATLNGIDLVVIVFVLFSEHKYDDDDDDDTFCVSGQLHQSRLPAAVPSRSTHKAAAAGLHDPHPALDVRPVAESKTPSF